MDGTPLVVNLTGLDFSNLESSGVFELLPDHKEHLLSLYRFEEVPDGHDLRAVVEVIVFIVAQAFGFDMAVDEEEGFYFRLDCFALLGGICPVFLLSSLEQALVCQLGIRIIYPHLLKVEVEPKTLPPKYQLKYVGAVEPFILGKGEDGEDLRYDHV